MSDNDDFFDQANSWAQKLHGESLTDDQIVNEFAVSGFERRVAMLHQIEQAEDKGEITDLRKAAHRMGLKRKLNNTHHALRLAGK